MEDEELFIEGLNPASLEKSYLEYFDEIMKSTEVLETAEAVDRFMQPYINYASRAIDPQGNAVISLRTSEAKKRMVEGFSEGEGFEAFKEAFVVFWDTAVFGKIVSSTVELETGSTVVEEFHQLSYIKEIDYSILDLIPKLSDSVEESAKHIAETLHLFTTSTVLEFGESPYAFFPGIPIHVPEEEDDGDIIIGDPGDEDPAPDPEPPPPDPDPDPEPSTEFVTVQGTNFMLDGRVFRFNGTNAYYLPNFAAPNSNLDSSVVDRAFNAFSNAGVKVIRMWGFYDGPAQWSNDNPIQPSPGVYNENSLRGLDRVIAEGKSRGMYFIIPFVNYWEDLGGIPQYMKWFGLSSASQFFHHKEAQNTYRNYISMILNRVNTETGVAYKNEPAIMAWQHWNEGTNPGKDPEILRDWYQDIAQYIKSIDSNHLVSTGEEGKETGHDHSGTPYSREDYHNTYVLRTGGTSYILNTQIPEIDFGSWHWYQNAFGFGSEWNSANRRAMLAWVRDHHTITRDMIGKPSYIGEYGLPKWGNSEQLDCYQTLWSRIESYPISGSLLWQYAADWVKCWEYGGNICYPSGRTDTTLHNAFRNHSNRHNTH